MKPYSNKINPKGDKYARNAHTCETRTRALRLNKKAARRKAALEVAKEYDSRVTTKGLATEGNHGSAAMV